MGMFSESVDVDCTASGQPLKLRWAGRQYTVCAEPVRWYERRQWWAEERRAPLGSGPGLVDHEIWRVQVRVGPAAIPGNRSPLTFPGISAAAAGGCCGSTTHSSHEQHELHPPPRFHRLQRALRGFLA